MNHVFTVRVRNTERSTKHEFGHAGGLGHWRDNDQYGKYDDVNPYAFGYLWPDPIEVSDPMTVCGDEPFVTVMTKESTIEIDGVKFKGISRLNHFSNPSIALSLCSGTKQIPTGSLAQNADGKWADASRRLVETLPALAQYRQPVQVLAGAEISSPGSGGAVGTSAAFAWNAGSPTGTYWIEIWDPATSVTYVDTGVSGTSYAASGLPGASTVLAVRLWTNLSPDPAANQWVWVDHRYNNDLSFVDCDEDPGVRGGTSWHGGACSDSVGPVCTRLAGVVTCDLARTGGSAGGEAFTISNFHSTGHAYDMAFWGEGDNGEQYCCLLNDPAGAVQKIVILGSANNDWISQTSVPYELSDYSNSPLTLEARGRAGDDWIIGSNSTSAGYTEVLRGMDGADVIFGNDGDDVLRGGRHDDVLFGGRGKDVLVGGQGYDELYGGPGGDTLCTKTAGDLLDGDSTDMAFNNLYISSTASGTPNANSNVGFWGFCGHPNWGTAWGGPCVYSLTSAPPECAAAGIPD